LVEFISACAFRENEILALGRLEFSAIDAIGKKGELGARAAGLRDVMKLIGVAEACRDQHFGAGRMPILKARRARLGVAAHLIR
jgi:hypothetical protein